MTENEKGMLLEEIEVCECLLIGIGEEWQAKQEPDIAAAYSALYELVKDKNFFVVTSVTDGKIFDSAFGASEGLLAPAKRITAPGDGDSWQQWDAYMDWLAHTLNRKLLILELGVGFASPEVIRWPFERTAFLNKKAKLYRVHEKFPQISEGLAEKSVSVEENSVKMILSCLQS